MKGKDWLSIEDNAIELMHGMNVKMYETLGIVTRKCLESGDINKWDITLLGKNIKIN